MAGVEFLVGGWFASPVIKCVSDKAKKYLEANYELQKDTRGLVETLASKLLLCQATVTDVEKGQIINNPALADWLRMLKLAVYDAEDVLDTMEAKSIKEKGQGKNKVSKFASSLSGVKNLFFPDDNHKSLMKVVDQLNQLSTDTQNILSLVNLNKINESHDHGFTDQRETISQQLEGVSLYGRDEELNLLLEIILGSDSEPSKKPGQNYNTYHGLSVIPIVGIGGVGKTALAQAVYNHPDVQDTFASKAWIYVSCNLDAELLMRRIIQSLGGYLHLDVITLEEVSKALSVIVSGVRFLVVLDGLSENIVNDWDVIVTILSHGAPGSVVLITTQNQAFADRVITSIQITLNTLDMDIFWELLEHFAFRNLVMSQEKRENLETIGRQIAQKLHGVPLAAKVIGTLLRSKVDEDEWRKISKSEWWNIPECKNRILPSIGLNYERLDPCLRQCFAYCSLFPKNSLIDKDRLVQMWIAQNFILHDNYGVRLEDIGRRWFDKLVEMSFLEPTWDYKGYVMPNLMHDLAIIVSSNECFYLRDESVDIPKGVRHLAIDTKNLEMVKRIQTCKNLRSFFYFGLCHIDGMYSAINNSLCYADGIRVLDLSYLLMKTKEPPTVIQNMTHLRFLDLSSTGVEILSNTSFDHYHLQTLHLRNCQFLTLPRGINKLINLRHFNAEAETIALISGIGKLTNLQELSVYTVDKNEHKISELKNLREITGHLTIHNCENIKSKDEAMQANLADKMHLDSVEICWSSVRRKSNIDIEILEGLRPHKHIINLTITNYMAPSFPDWAMNISLFTTLKIVMLDCAKVEGLPPFGELPSLRELRLKVQSSIKIIDYNFYGNKQTVFPALTYFYFSFPSSCEEWTEPQIGEFLPHLVTLEINHCNLLREVPFHFMGNSLKALYVHRCPMVNSLGKYLYHLNSLTILSIHKFDVSVSLNFGYLRLLEKLMLRDCPELSIEGDLRQLTNLKSFEIENCPKLLNSRQKGKGLQVHQGEGLQSLTIIEMDQSLLPYEYTQIFGRLPSLRVLMCRNSEVRQFTRYQILWFQELTTLQELTINNCNYEQLPSNLAMISSLKKVTLSLCTELECLPADGMPPFLWELTLTSCSPNLVQRCQPNEGEDWPLISHVPLIRIDGRIVHRAQSSEGHFG